MTDDLKARLRCDVNEHDNLGRRKNWTEQRSERRKAADRIEDLEAALARIKHLMPADHTLFAESARYIARAALAGGGDV